MIAKLLIDSDSEQLIEFFSGFLIRFLFSESLAVIFEMVFDGWSREII